MKALTCEMCGSTNLLKQDGVFVCQSCGTKYSVEEAKKMMVEGTVDVKGTVKVDTSDELKNLYEVARRAKDSDNSENATKYYEMILVKDPSSWEANFYVVYIRAMSCKIAEIMTAANNITNCVGSVLGLVKDNITDPEEQHKIIEELYDRVSFIGNMLFNAAKSHYDSIDAMIKNKFVQDYANKASATAGIFYIFGNKLIENFSDSFGAIASNSWKQAIEIHRTYITILQDKEGNKKVILEYVEKIRKYDSSYQTPYVDTTSGCYVATAVYGSYDCPEVWTLRRFRDNTLAGTWYGRAFIHTYYAISPTLVKWFGHTEWFKKMWKEPLDSLVHKLQSQGVENTPYNDRIW